MATSWKSQQGKGEYALQFETDDEGKYKLVEKAAQMAMDGKTADDLEEVAHGYWMWGRDDVQEVLYAICSHCKRNINFACYGYERCPRCGAKMYGRSEK